MTENLNIGSVLVCLEVSHYGNSLKGNNMSSVSLKNILAGVGIADIEQ